VNKLITLTGPSGCGKTSLVKAVGQVLGSVEVVTYTTRRIRSGEVEGLDYFFLENDEFDKIVETGDLIAVATLFKSKYGTSKSSVDHHLKTNHVLLVLGISGVSDVKNVYPDSINIWVKTPNKSDLEDRMIARGDDRKSIEGRLSSDIFDNPPLDKFDHILINDDFDTTVSELLDIISS